MDFEIIELSPAESEKCGNIRNMKQQEKSAEQFCSELISGNLSPMYTNRMMNSPAKFLWFLI
jgi:hypothetical protein